MKNVDVTATSKPMQTNGHHNFGNYGLLRSATYEIIPWNLNFQYYAGELFKCSV
jgi:hypothetical protein